MRQAPVALGVCALVLAAATAGQTQQRAASCAGVACGQVAASAETCEAHNKSDQPVRLMIFRNARPGMSAPQPLDLNLAPGERRTLRVGASCPIDAGIAHLMASYVSAGPGGDQPKAVRPGDMFAVAKPKCSGASCRPVSLKVLADCVWVESTSADPIAMSVKVGAETLNVVLEGASPAKAAERQRRIDAGKVSGPTPAEAQRCDKLFKSEAALKQMRARGSSVPYNPEIDGGAEACRAADARRKTAERALQDGPKETAYHAKVFDARSLGTGELLVFRAKLLPKSGCVKSDTEVVSFTANPVK